MTAIADHTSFIKLLESLDSIGTGEELIAWVSKELQTVFPHGAFICCVGRIHRTGVSPVKVFTSNFPPDYLRALKLPDGLYLSPIMKNWLASGEVQLFDSEGPIDVSLDKVWLDRFKDSSLKNIVAHGAYDLSRHHASYFSFHQIPGPLGESHRNRVRILVPHMHAALLRILHKLKAESRAARPDRTLTTRELEVLTWVSDGKTSSEIADILGIALSTVRNQIQSTLVKLRVNTRSQAVAKAIKKGLVINRQPDSQFGGF